MNDIYADSIGNVRLAGTNVRIDLLVVGDQPDKDGKPTMQKKAELIMPLSGLIRANTQIQNVLDQLTEKGVLKKNEKSEEAPKKLRISFYKTIINELMYEHDRS